MYSTYPKNPWNAREFAIPTSVKDGQVQDFLMVELDVDRTRDNTAHIKFVYSSEHKQGHGSAAMRELMDRAKKANVSLSLSAWEHGKVSASKLKRWYKRLGFKEDKTVQTVLIYDPS